MVHHSFAPEWSYEETKSLILGIDDLTTRTFAGITYVLGARLNEARSLLSKDINVVQNKLGEDMLLVQVFTLKNVHVEKRHVPINPIKEKEYADMLLWFKETFSDIKTIQDAPFKQRSEDLYQDRLRKYLDIHPHALRHLRVHHIDDKEVPGMQGLTPRQFKDLFGWALIETSAHYQSRTRGRDLTDLF